MVSSAAEVLYNSDLLQSITQFQPGSKFKDWADGDKSMKLGYYNLMRLKQDVEAKDFFYTSRATWTALENGDLPILQFILRSNKNQFTVNGSTLAGLALETIRWSLIRMPDRDPGSVDLEEMSFEAREQFEDAEQLEDIDQFEDVNQFENIEPLMAVEFMCNDAERLEHPLLVATWRGHLHIVKWLMTHTLGWQKQVIKCYYMAVRRGHVELVEHLFERLRSSKALRTVHGKAITVAAIFGAAATFLWLQGKAMELYGEYIPCEIQTDSLEILQWILANQPRYSMWDRCYHRAVSSGSLQTVQWMEEVLPHQSQFSGDLYALAMEGHLDMLRYFYEIKPKKDKRSGTRLTFDTVTLSCISGKGHVHVLKWIKEKGLDASAFDRAALEKAVYGGHYETVKWILTEQEGSSLNESIPVLWKYAAHNGDLKLLDLLYTHYKGAASLFSMHSAMEAAASMGHPKVIDYFLERTGGRCMGIALILQTIFGGHLSLLKHLHGRGLGSYNLDQWRTAIKYGHLHVAKFLWNELGLANGELPFEIKDIHRCLEREFWNLAYWLLTLDQATSLRDQWIAERQQMKAAFKERIVGFFGELLLEKRKRYAEDILTRLLDDEAIVSHNLDSANCRILWVQNLASQFLEQERQRIAMNIEKEERLLKTLQEQLEVRNQMIVLEQGQMETLQRLIDVGPGEAKLQDAQLKLIAVRKKVEEDETRQRVTQNEIAVLERTIEECRRTYADIQRNLDWFEPDNESSDDLTDASDSDDTSSV